MGINNKVIYSFKSSSSQLSNYKIYGSDEYSADYKIYGNTVDNNSVGDLINIFDGNFVQGTVRENFPSGTSYENIRTTNLSDTSLHNQRLNTSNLIYVNNSCTISANFTKYKMFILKFDNNHLYTGKYINWSTNSVTITDSPYISITVGKLDDSEFTPSDATDVNLMVNYGTTALKYEPYGYKVPIRVTGKNLLKPRATGTNNGVTFTVNSDGSVTCNGTATNTSVFYVPIFLTKGNYIVSGCPSNGSNASYIGTVRYRTPVNGSNVPPFPHDDSGNGVILNIAEDYNELYQYVIRINTGYTCNNLTFYPMIRKADIEDSTYEPYKENIKNIYLDTPLTKSEDNCDYIDFKEQKRVNIDGTEMYLALPELKIESENDSIFVDTTTKPSNIDFNILHGVGSKTENLFDENSDVIADTYINDSGVLTSYVGIDTYDYIPVEPDTPYYRISLTSQDLPIRVAYYDSSKTFISRIKGGPVTFKTPTNCAYIRLSINRGSGIHLMKVMLTKGDAEPTIYVPYGYKIPIKVQGKNLFNSSVDQGGFNNDGKENTSASGVYYTNRLRSGHINLIHDKVYTISSNMNIKAIIAYYDNRYVSTLLVANTNLLFYTITMPTNANNIRISFWSGVNNIAVEPSDFEWCQIETGDSVTEYEEPYSSINNIYLNRPLLKDGSDYDYIDYSEQKLYNSDGTIEDVSIPHVLTNTGMNKLTFDTSVQPIKSSISYIDEDAKVPVIDQLKTFEIDFTTSETQLINYQIYGSSEGVGDTNLFDFDAWWETVKGNTNNGTITRGPNKSFTITPTGPDAYTKPYISSDSWTGYRISVEPNTSYTLSWDKECSNNAYYGNQFVFLNGISSNGFRCDNNTTMTFTTRSDTSFIMLRFGCGTNTDTPITFSNIKFRKTTSNSHILMNMRDVNNIATWDKNLIIRPSKKIEYDATNMLGSIINVTNISQLYVTGDKSLCYGAVLRIGKSNSQIVDTTSTIDTYMEYYYVPAIIDTSDCNYIIISLSRYSKPSSLDDLRASFKIYTTPPNNTLITLPKQLMKTDNGCDYIDYSTQKLYNTDNTTTNMTIPPIKTVVGKNKLRLPQDIKPSKIMIHYKQ